MGRRLTSSAAAFALGLYILSLAGCGTPGAPSPPSLRLPAPISDLAAVRAGNQVTLSFTMPRRDTDKVALSGNVTVAICRKERTDACIPAGTIAVAPGTKGTFAETLPPALAAGPPRLLTYFIELRNRRNRSAGPSNGATVLAGEAPAPVAGFAAALHREGVAFRWTAGDSTQSVRLFRKLISTPQEKKKDSGPLAPPRQAPEQTLLVDSDSGRALDREVEFGSAYEYRAQRLVRVAMDGKTIELGGELSAPFRITFQDAFPPSVPDGLAAVATAASTATPPSIGLSWLPVIDRNLAGYIVYRREGDGPWQRISPEQPVIGPGFRDTQVTPGRTYHYAVTSISLTGHESDRSAEAEETVPSQ
jgi:hypothetical protein